MLCEQHDFFFPFSYSSSAVHPTKVKQCHDNIEHIESMPFDGMFVNAPVDWRITNGAPVSYEAISEELGILKGAFKKFKHNFLHIFTDFTGDF